MKRFYHAVTSSEFRIAFGIMFLSFLGFSMPEWVASRDWGVIGQPSALQLSLMAIFFGGVSLLFPFCVCNVNCQRRTREHDAALHRRKPAMGSSSSCRAHHEAPFRRQIGKHLHLAALVHFLPSSRDSFSVLPSHLLDTLPGTNRAPKSCRTMSYNVAQSRETPKAICAIM